MPTLKITHYATRDVFVIEADKVETIQQVKEAIERKTGIPVLQQRLIYDKKLLSNDEILEANGIQEGEYELVLVVHSPPVTIHIRFGASEVLVVDMDQGQTIQQVKEAIESKIGIPVVLQELSYNRKSLTNDKTLGELGFKKGAYIFELYPPPPPPPPFMQTQDPPPELLGEINRLVNQVLSDPYAKASFRPTFLYREPNLAVIKARRLSPNYQEWLTPQGVLNITRDEAVERWANHILAKTLKLVGGRSTTRKRRQRRQRQKYRKSRKQYRTVLI